MITKNDKKNINKKLNTDKTSKKNENINNNITKDINLGNVQYKSKELKKNNLLSKAYLGVVNILADYVDNYIDEEKKIEKSVRNSPNILNKKSTSKSIKSNKSKKNLNNKDEEKNRIRSHFIKSKTKVDSTIYDKNFKADSIDVKGESFLSFKNFIKKRCNSNLNDQKNTNENISNDTENKEKEKVNARNSFKFFDNILNKNQNKTRNKNRNNVISDDSSKPINYNEFTLTDNDKNLIENINKNHTSSMKKENKDINNINSSTNNNNPIQLSINNRIINLKKNFNSSQNSIVSSISKLEKKTSKKINKKKTNKSTKNNLKCAYYKTTDIISNKAVNTIQNSLISVERKSSEKLSGYSSDTLQRINKKDLEFELNVDNNINKKSTFSNKEELLKFDSLENIKCSLITNDKLKDVEKNPRATKIKFGYIESKRKFSNSNIIFRKYKSLKQKDTIKSNRSIKTTKSRKKNSPTNLNMNSKYLNSEQIKNELSELKNNIKKQLKINSDDIKNPIKKSVTPKTNNKNENIEKNNTQNSKEIKIDKNNEHINEIKKDSIINKENSEIKSNNSSDIESENDSEKSNNNEIELMNDEEKRKQIHERYRALTHKNLVYDSLDDEEVEEEEKNFYFEPENKFILIFDFIIAINSFYYLIYIPIYLARNLNFCRPSLYHINELYNLFIDLCFACDVALSFFRSYYNFEEFLIKDNALMIHNYICTWFIIDVICAVPMYTIIMFLEEKCNLENFKFLTGITYDVNFNKIYYLLTLLKVLKVFKVLSTNNQMRNKIKEKLLQSDFYESWRALIMQISLTILSLNLSGCIYIYIGRNSYPSWITSLKLDSKNFTCIYVTSIYFLVATLTTVGYGDVTSFSMNEKYFHLFLLIVGICAYSWMISSVSNYIKKMSEKSASYEKRVKILDDIRLAYPDLHDDLYDKILRHLSYRKYHEKNNKAIIIDCLPYPLRNSLIIEMYRSVINNFIFFKGSENSDFIVKVVLSFKPVLAMKNDLLVQEGEFIEDIIFVKQGVICLEIFLDTDNIDECIEGYLSDNLFKNSLINNNLFTWNNQNVNNINSSNIYSSLIMANNMIDKKGLTQIEGINKTFGKTTRFFNKYKTYLVENEDNTYCKLRVIDIRRNEYFGDILMFLNLRSPLSIRVKSKKAELFFLKKMDAVNLSTAYPNIWKRINKKSVFNLEQIKKQIQKVVLTYCNSNGIKTNKDSNFISSSLGIDQIGINNLSYSKKKKDKGILIKKIQRKNANIRNSNKSISLESESSMSSETVQFSNKTVKTKNINDEKKAILKKSISLSNNDLFRNKWADTSEIITEEEPSVDKEKSTPDNSKSNHDNSKSNHDNSKSTPDNSKSNHDNSKSNHDNSKSTPDNSKSNPNKSKKSTRNNILKFSKSISPRKNINCKEENNSKNGKSDQTNSIEREKTKKIKNCSNDIISFSEINNLDVDLMFQKEDTLYDLDENGNKITPYKCYEINDEIYKEENSNLFDSNNLQLKRENTNKENNKENKNIKSKVEDIKYNTKINIINTSEKKDDYSSSFYKKYGNGNTIDKSASAFSICDNVKTEKEQKKFKLLIKCKNSSLLFESIYENINKITGGQYSKDLTFQKKCKNLLVQEKNKLQRFHTKNLTRNFHNKNHSYVRHSVTNNIFKNNRITKSCTIKTKKTAVEPSVSKLRNIRVLNNNLDEKSLNDINNAENKIDKSEDKSESNDDENNFYTKVRTMKIDDIKPVNLNTSLRKKRRCSVFEKKTNELENIVSNNIYKSSQNLNNPGEFYTDFFKKIIKKQIKKYNKKLHRSRNHFSPIHRSKDMLNTNFFTNYLNKSCCDNNYFKNPHNTHTKRPSEEASPKNKCNRSCFH